jgi:hypothetical protein
MVIKDLFKKKQPKDNPYEYTEERATGLKTAMAMASKQKETAMAMASKQKEYEKTRRKFERQQKEEQHSRLYKMAVGLQRRIAKARPTAYPTKQLVAKRMARVIYPNIPASVAPAPRSGKGRPKGSVKYPGGIYKWRKLMRAQKAVARYETLLRQSRAMQNYPQMVAGRILLPQEVPIPQEMQPQIQQQVENVQYPQHQTQYEQYQYPIQPQQYTPEPQKRPIATVFKSSGGSPYPPVNPQPLQPSNQTIPQGYVEATDLMTGRRYIKPLPRKEAWIS